MEYAGPCTFDVGATPFGPTSGPAGCNAGLAATRWPINTDLVAWQILPVPSSAVTLRIAYIVDNDITVWIDVVAGPADQVRMRPHGACQVSGEFLVPASAGPGIKLAVRAHDHGGVSWFDMKISYELAI